MIVLVLVLGAASRLGRETPRVPVRFTLSFLELQPEVP